MRRHLFSPILKVPASFVFLATLLTPLSAQFPSTASSRVGSQVHVLIIGGGTSHNFEQNYKETDATTLTRSGVSVQYTDSFRDLPAQLARATTVIQASNGTAPEAGTRRVLMDFVARGGGLVAVHAGAWYNWADWPEYNRLLIGGGTRDHDKPGRFEVTVIAPNNPVMAGVPAHFEIEDELYHQELAPDGPPTEVLATAYSAATRKSYPSVWIVKGQSGRIVCIALGHDERAHQAPAYQTILKNAVEWTANRGEVANKKP